MCFHVCVCKQRQLIDCVYPGASLSFIRFLSQRVGKLPAIQHGIYQSLIKLKLSRRHFIQQKRERIAINSIQLVDTVRRLLYTAYFFLFACYFIQSSQFSCK